jgi:hypothetical protein
VRRPFALTVLAAVLWAVGACSGDGNVGPGDPEETDGAAGSMTVEQFCDEYGPEELAPRHDDVDAAMERFGQELPNLTPADRDELEAIVEDLDNAVHALAAAYHAAADELADPAASAAVADVGDQFQAFVAAVRDTVLVDEMPDEDPTEALTDAQTDLFDALQHAFDVINCD